jgi:drug/metabolite transporter (DMT)-like permease
MSQVSARDEAAQHSNDALIGALFVLVSGIGFGSVTVLARIAFDEGSNAPTSLALRFGLGAAIFWLLLLARQRVRRLPTPKIAVFALMGVLFAAGSTASFMSVERIPASLAALVFYIYPAIVTAGSALFFGTRFSLPQLGVLVGAVTGCALTVDLRSGDIDRFGLALALATPCFYSCYVLIGSRATLGVAPLNASAWIMTFAAPLMVLLGITGAVGNNLTSDISSRGLAAIAGLTIFSTVISISTFLAGMARLDPFRASILSTIEPVVSVILAALLLSERLTAQQILGGVIIVSSTIALQVVQRKRDAGRGMRDSG